ncbi:hypothetical protein SDC9_208492 [bioreactor metagenome]|uniref:Uncharacterized protein n=1 Tax=bioreactor metagenome TaxID=1076179 RepID=A0A645JCH4_9ZZZZ
MPGRHVRSPSAKVFLFEAGDSDGGGGCIYGPAGSGLDLYLKYGDNPGLSGPIDSSSDIYFTYLAWRHKGGRGVNVSFYDGHVKSMNYTEVQVTNASGFKPEMWWYER